MIADTETYVRQNDVVNGRVQRVGLEAYHWKVRTWPKAEIQIEALPTNPMI